MTHDETVKCVIREVNTMRKKLGLKQIRKLRRGYPGKANGCPIANSVRAGAPEGSTVSVGFTGMAFYTDGKRMLTQYPTNSCCAEFIRDFDHGKFREYRMAKGGE